MAHVVLTSCRRGICIANVLEAPTGLAVSLSAIPQSWYLERCRRGRNEMTKAGRLAPTILHWDTLCRFWPLLSRSWEVVTNLKVRKGGQRRYTHDSVKQLQRSKHKIAMNLSTMNVPKWLLPQSLPKQADKIPFAVVHGELHHLHRLQNSDHHNLPSKRGFKGETLPNKSYSSHLQDTDPFRQPLSPMPRQCFLFLVMYHEAVVRSRQPPAAET